MKKDNLEAIYPLSPMQEGMLFHSLYAPQLEVYFEQFAYTLRGDLNIPAFKAAWELVVAHHPVLRTLFLWENLEKPLQVVRKHIDIPWSEHDWQGIPKAEQDERVQAWLQTDRVQGFDLSHAPLLRLNLIRLSEQVIHFTWSFHHLLLDGWSVFTVMGQVFNCYEAFRQGKPFHLASHRPYRDYITWLRQQELAQAESFWRETLRGFTSPTPLGIDRTSHRVSELPGDYHSQQVRLSEAMTASLQKLARQQQMTLNTLVQGAWALLLSRYSGESDVVFGTTVSGRPPALADVELMVGMFINTLPVRVQVDPQQELLPWLQDLQTRQVEARQYEYSPLMRVQDWSEIPRGQPLFESLLIFASYPADASFVEESSLTIEQVQVIEHTNYPLTVSVTPFASLLIRTNYAGTHFAHDSIIRMLGHLQTLLENMVINPLQRLAKLSLLSRIERQQYLFDWNTTQTDFPQETCLSLFEQQVERAPEAVALAFEEQQVTYGELNARANQLAHYLQGLGVGPEVCVGLFLDRSIEMIIGLSGILKAGGAYVPLDPAYPPQRLTLMLQETQVRVLLTQQALLPYLPSHEAPVSSSNLTGDAGANRTGPPAWTEEIICLDSGWSRLAHEDRYNPQNEAAMTNLAYIIYTSGSTGQPKGTLVEHCGLANLVAAQVRLFAIKPSSRVLQYASLSFDAAVSEIFTTLLTGALLVLEPKEALYPGPGLIQEMEKQDISVVTLPPSVLAVLPSTQLPALHTLVVAGEACSAAIVARWAQGRNFLNAYGPTEASVCATVATLTDSTRPPTIGRPIDNVQVYVLDESLDPVPVGVIGELYIASVGLARGYLHRSALTAERFLPDPFSREPGARFYRTGDIVRYLPNGELEFLGRRDGQVKVRGYRIEMREIEVALHLHPSINDVVVLAREEEAPGEQADNRVQAVPNTFLVAYLVAQAGSVPTISEVRAYLLQHLPEYMIPAVYMWLDTLPRLPNGKVDRRALPLPEGTRPELEKAYVAPGTALEEYLVGVWQELLKIETVGIHDNFFELGGDSIKAVLAINKVQERLGKLIYAVALFDAPTVAQLANYLGEQYSEEVSKLFGQEALPSPPSSPVPTHQSDEPLIDGEKVRLLRQVIAPLAPYPPQLEPIVTKNPPAVFLLSPPRSGSTLLRVMLAGHPRLFAPPELELLSFQTLGERFTAFAGRNAFWLEGLIRAVMEIKACDAGTAQRLIADYEAQNLPTQQFYQLLQEWLGDRLLVDKTPAYALDLAILQRAEREFHEARYLHLVRHPRAMIRSFEEARLDQVFFRHAHSFSRRELAELIWIVCQQNIQEFLGGIPARRQYQISFEELVQAPQKVMEGICQFLQIEYHPAMIEPYQGKRMTDGIHAFAKMIGDIKFHEHQGIDASVAEQWKEREQEDEPGEITWEIAATLGYHIPENRRIDKASAKELPPIIPRRVDGKERLPLSYVQERLWFLSQWDSQSAVYNIYSLLQLQGRLHVSVLERSFNAMVQRHEVLRTTFQAPDGHPWQVIASILHIPLLFVDLCGVPTSERETVMQQLFREEVQRPFDLSRGPLLRATLLRLKTDEHIFLLIMHHSIADGWSMSIFNRELASLYEAFARNLPSPLPELPIQYADYTLWQREALNDSSLQSQLAYWKQQLADLSVLALPTDHIRPAIQRFQGRTFRFRFPQELTATLKLLSQREGVTLFMLLLAGFQILLSRYSRQTDIVVGTPIANRTRSEVEGLIGPFVNTLVLRVDLSGNPSVRKLLARVRQLTLEAYTHQDLPFDKLVEVLNPQRSMSHHPLFQVMFALHNTPSAHLALPEMQVRLLTMDTATAHFDLTLNLYDEPAGLTGDIEYDCDLFEEQTIERLGKHYLQLLTAMASSPERRLRSLPLLTEAEQVQLHAWNETRREYRHDASLSKLFEEQAEQTPEAVALVFEEQQLTYGELNARANQLAHYLRQLGIGEEKLVGLCLERCIEMVVGLLAILKAGGAYVPLDPGYPRERLAFMLQDAQISVLLTQAHLRDHFEEEPVVVRLDSDWPVIAQESRQVPAQESLADNLAYVIYTSGSTGQPKGVLVQQCGAIRLVCEVDYAQLNARQTLLQMAPISFDAATFELWAALLHGGRCVLFAGDMIGGERIGEVIRREQVTTLWLTASLFNVIIDEFPEALTGVQQLLIGGEALSVSHVRRGLEALSDVRIINGYGPTENTTFSCCDTIIRPLPSNIRSIPIGRPIAHTQAYVLDQEGQPVPVGVAGELYLAGRGLARGYLKQAELTAERFVPHPFSSKPGERLYRTGDLVRYLPDGRLEFLEREDGQVKLRGFRIELGEIETVLTQHEEVQEVVVILYEKHLGEKRLVAYVVAQQPQRVLSSADLRRFLMERLPDYMVPATFIQIEMLPLTPNGKLDYQSLPVPEGSQNGPGKGYIAPHTPPECVLADIWTDLLGVEQIGIHDNFFELGGHSLIATRVISRVRTLFQADLSVVHLFGAPTIAGLAETLIQSETVAGQITAIAKVRLKLKHMSAGQVRERLNQIKKTRGK